MSNSSIKYKFSFVSHPHGVVMTYYNTETKIGTWTNIPQGLHFSFGRIPMENGTWSIIMRTDRGTSEYPGLTDEESLQLLTETQENYLKAVGGTYKW